VCVYVTNEGDNSTNTTSRLKEFGRMLNNLTDGTMERIGEISHGAKGERRRRRILLAFVSLSRRAIYTVTYVPDK
jgi:hypothetical protein